MRLRSHLAVWALLLAVGGCQDINWPFHHHGTQATPPSTAEGSGAGPDASQCADLLAQIRQSQEERREAVTTSVDPDIVRAAQGKADRRISQLQQQYDDLDCPADEVQSTTRPHRQPPLQPAPGAGSH